MREAFGGDVTGAREVAQTIGITYLGPTHSTSSRRSAHGCRPLAYSGTSSSPLPCRPTYDAQTVWQSISIDRCQARLVARRFDRNIYHGV
jgi:hypothetical protein